jgi:hypothetical protein
MKKHRIHAAPVLTILLAGFFCCARVSTGQEQKSDVDRVLSSFPGFHLVTFKERDADARAFIAKHFPKDNPSIVNADFDGDGNLDYALLLKNDKSQTAKLVVLLCSVDRRCHTVYEVDLTTNSGIVYLRPIATGSVVSQTDAIDSRDSPPLKLKSSGIQVSYFGKAVVVLYWNRKLRKMEEVQTED